ncbi:helix-turn-helix transcriptional regulator [Frigoribacterium sp. 2-23]|uniref:helix-turn-helix transcriptional regulator n=1 Tax=Frigoribacterium sp. 2-23 TaxID=3415006 RepID=UPI003C6F9843
MSGPTSRMLVLLSLLQTRRDWPGQLLSERLDVSDRTVRRDVDRLRDLGYRIHATKGPDGGYRLDAGSELPPLLFDDEQALALAIALQSAAQPDSGIEEAAVRALTTVRQVMPSRLRHRMDALNITALPSRPGGGAPVDPEVLALLGTAVRDRLVVRFDYATEGRPVSVTDTAPPRRAEPHHLVTNAGRWYLVAWSLDREAWRTYRVDRMTPRTQLGARFAPREVPGGDVAAFVAGRFKGSTTDGVDRWPCTGEVIIDAAVADVAPYVADAVVSPVGGDPVGGSAGRERCRVVAGAWSWAGLAASLMRFDADVEVVGPEPLREAFAALARRAAAAARTSF